MQHLDSNISGCGIDIINIAHSTDLQYSRWKNSIVTDLTNIDTQFKQVSNADFNIDDQNMTTTVASITTREIQEIDSPFNDMFMKVDIPDAYRVDAKSFIERPFYVDEVTFPDTAVRYSLLSSTVKFLPGDIARSNASVLNMFKMAAYGRPDLIINVSMAGTITHAGCVLVGVLPPLPSFPAAATPALYKRLINTILSGPHAFLHANEATSVAIPVPWYCNTDLATTDMEQKNGYDTTLDITEVNGNYATLVYMVLNPLMPSTGSTKSLRIIVEACFKNFDLAVPTPRYVDWVTQSGRGMYNPLYDEFDKLAKQHGITEWVTSSPRKRSRMIKQLQKIVPYMGAAVTITGILLRIGYMCMTGDEVSLPSDDLDSIQQEQKPIDHLKFFVPQAGVLSGLSHLATGLLDSAASGLKVVTSDAIDAGRKLVRSYTGLHNPNIPQIHERIITTPTNFVNNVDAPQFFEKLDPYTNFNRIVGEPIFGSNVDEMAISNIVTKKQMLGTFKVDINDGVGVLKWARPISPFQGGAGTSDGELMCHNNIELMHSFSRAWRGTLKLTLQSVMNNKQQCKLKVVKMYNPSTKITSAYPVYKTIANAPTHLLEFTQGGQEHEITLPYLCRNDLTPCATNMDTEALFHGVYYVYVAQPLVVSDSSPTSIEFNVFMSGEPDLTFYGYTTSNTYHAPYGMLPRPSANAMKDKSGKPVTQKTLVSMSHFEPGIAFYKHADDKDLTMQYIYMESGKRAGLPDDRSKWNAEVKADFERYKVSEKQMYDIVLNNFNEVKQVLGDKFEQFKKTWTYSKSLRCTKVDTSKMTAKQITDLKRVMMANERQTFVPQSGKVTVMNEPQHQTHTTRVESKEQNLTHMTRLMPTLDIRPFIRRMYKSQVYDSFLDPGATGNGVIKLSSFIGEAINEWNYTPIETFSRMYYGKTVGFKFRCVITLNGINNDTISNVDLLNFRLYYLPQSVNALTSSKVVASALTNINSFLPVLNPTIGTPLPFQIISKDSTSTHVIYEFSVPDTSFYKFMGGPNKFYDFDSNASPSPLAQADFGAVVLQFTNLSKDKLASYAFELFVGLTDESRFGYHAMAPPFIVFKESASYLGTNTSSTTPSTKVLNPFIYRGGYL